MTCDTKRALVGVVVVAVLVMIVVALVRDDRRAHAWNRTTEDQNKRLQLLEYQLKVACSKGIRMTKVITGLVDNGQLPELAFRVNALHTGWQAFCELPEALE